MCSSDLLDFLGSAQGSVLYRGASTWAALAPGASGSVLTSGGASANPSWAQKSFSAPVYSNLKIDVASDTTVTVTASTIILISGTDSIAAPNFSTTISTTTTGVNGLDAGTIANNTWYAVWAISNGTTFAGLISTSATAPSMPSGYTFKTRIGWVDRKSTRLNSSH